MENKIIINGVDVSGCKYFGTQCNCTIHAHLGCATFPNCDYKQRQRMKAALMKIDRIARSNLCYDDCDNCLDNCECDWKDIVDIIEEVKKQKCTDTCKVCERLNAKLRRKEKYDKIIR